MLLGLGSADVLEGGGGADSLDGGADDDGLYGGAGGDSLLGGAGSDLLVGGSQADFLYGGDGDDALSGGSSGDRLFGGDGRDRLYGGSGIDRMEGGAGDDYYVLDQALDRIVEAEGGGRDRVAASVSSTLAVHVEELALLGTADLDGTGNALANRLTGNGGANTLRGLDGDDRIEGGGGADLLVGGLGRDVLRGGDGADLFAFLSTADSPSRAGADAIHGFVAGEDRIDLSALDAIEATAGTDDAFVLDTGGAFEAGEVRQVREGPHWRIEVETTGDGVADLVILLGDHATPLSEADFAL